MIRTRSLLTGLCAFVLVFIAACGGTESGTLDSDGGEATGTETAGPDGSADPGVGGSPSLAPPVPDPLDPELLLSEPCDLLTEDQLDELGLVEYDSRMNVVDSPECVWAQSDSGHNKVRISALPPNENGLDDIYAQRDEMSYFEPTEINGYPAVFGSDYGKPSDAGRCGIFFGVTDELVASVFAQTDREPEVDDPCPFTHEATEAMIDTLQG